jgi:hypothetical protein
MISLTARDQSVETRIITFQNGDGVTATAPLEKLRDVKPPKKIRPFLEKQATEQPIKRPQSRSGESSSQRFHTLFLYIIPSNHTLSSDRARHRDRKTEVPLRVEARFLSFP